MARRVFFIFCLNSFFAMRIAEAAAILCQHSGDSETKHSWDAKMAARSLDFLSPSGDKLDLYTLSSKDGIEVDVLSFEAVLTSISAHLPVFGLSVYRKHSRQQLTSCTALLFAAGMVDVSM